MAVSGYHLAGQRAAERLDQRLARARVIGSRIDEDASGWCIHGVDVVVAQRNSARSSTREW